MSALPQIAADSGGAALDAIVASLAVPRQQIEAAFVDVGDRLTRSAGLLDRIASVFEELPRDLDRPELIEATERLAEVGRSAEKISISFAAEQADISRLVEMVAGANRPIAELRQAIRMMGILAINARVVAAGVADNLEDSEVFTSDIATLSSSATKTIAEFSALYARLAAEVQKAAEQRAHFEAEHAGSLAQLAGRIETSLGEVTRHRQHSADGSAETVRVSRAIGQRVMTAVMALQVGDATRQRVEHVEAALGGLPDAFIGAVAELAGAQLADTIETLDFEVVEAQRALEELAADAQMVTERSRAVYGEGAADGQSGLSQLSIEMRRATAVLRGCEAERQKLGTVAAAVEATVKVLLEHVEAVQDIEANMRLVSLNAAIKCAQLGPRGAALNVIARQLRDLTGETVLAAESAASGLGEVAELALAFSAASSGEAADQVGRLEREANEAVALMETVDVRIRDALAVLSRDGPVVADLLGGTTSSFRDHAAISEALSDAHVQIAGMGVPAGRVEPGSGLAELLARLRRSYTMESERRIHDAMWGKPAVSAPVAEDVFEEFGAEAVEESDDVLLF